MNFKGIDAVVYGVTDMALGRRYLTDWGLRKTASTASRAVFETEDGSQVILRPHDAKDLPPAVESGSSVREVIWGVGSRQDLDSVANELGRDRPVTVDGDGTVHSTDCNGYGIGFRLWKKKPIKARRARVNAPDSRERIGRHGLLYPRARPVRLGHVVFATPDFVASEKFYTDRLGFYISDWQTGQAVYLRYAVESDHHNLFFMTRGRQKRPAFHHLAFEVRDIHEVLGGGMYFKSRGWKTEVGPGRHTVSSAYFWYFRNPCGGMTEYFADMDIPDARWKPKRIPTRPGTFAEWTLRDGISWLGGGAHDVR